MGRVALFTLGLLILAAGGARKVSRSTDISFWTMWALGVAMYLVIFAAAGIWIFLSRDPRPGASKQSEQ